MTGQGGFAGRGIGPGHLLKCLNTLFVHSPHPRVRKALLFPVISKSPPAGAPASMAGDAEKKHRCTAGKNNQDLFLKGGDEDHPCLH